MKDAYTIHELEQIGPSFKVAQPERYRLTREYLRLQAWAKGAEVWEPGEAQGSVPDLVPDHVAERLRMEALVYALGRDPANPDVQQLLEYLGFCTVVDNAVGIAFANGMMGL